MSWRRPSLPVLVLLAASCTDGTGVALLSPEVTLSVVSGSGQAGLIGQELPQPLVVRVTATNGKGIKGQLVNFKATGGGDSMYAGAALTDANGNAQDYWTLGATRGTQQVDVVDT